MTLIDTPQTAVTQALPRSSRDQYLKVVQVALAEGEPRYARDACLSWLAAYPGDLQAHLYYAQALLGLGRSRQAASVLERVCQLDPEFVEAVEALLQAEVLNGGNRVAEYTSILAALNGNSGGEKTVTTWGRQLWMSRLAVQRKGFEHAEQMITHVLAADPPTALAALSHLQVLEARGQASVEAKRLLAEHYHEKWPNCLAINLMLADWLMDSGESDQAVILLHQAAAQDVSGQVARRIWGDQHPYQNLWPSGLSLSLPPGVPASVAARLGWNRLPSGEGAGSRVKASGRQISSFEEMFSAVFGDRRQASLGKSPAEQRKVADAAAGFERLIRGATSLKSRSIKQAEAGAASLAAAAEERPLPEELKDVQQELEQAAAGLSRAGVTKEDGRFPVYVIFSVQSRLQALYGVEGAKAIATEMQALAEALPARQKQQTRQSWGAQVFFADQDDSISAARRRTVKPGDPWDLKLVLADLAESLSHQGERIGGLLIVGGPEIVPFHHLPNPTDDEDEDIPSDNPYGTRDANYFIPEWPVGRIPGGAGSDPAVIIESLRSIRNPQQAKDIDQPWYAKVLQFILGLFQAESKEQRLSFGFTAATWRKSSLGVFQSIGDASAMQISPAPRAQEEAHTKDPILAARLGYFNLHGIADSSDWYGQRDPLESPEGPDFPVALRPGDINPGRSWQVVFSEACYGAYIQDKTPEEAIVLKMLASGCRAIVASTAISYGSISSPLIAADLLGFNFWKAVRSGLPAGEALRQAKAYLAQEMTQRQGYLDGEDQKSLISFVLYGDPLAVADGASKQAKGNHTGVKVTDEVVTICDRSDQPQSPQVIPVEMMDYIKHVVSQYLPGMADARMSISRESLDCHSGQHLCPTGQLQTGAKGAPKGARRLVTLSKHVRRNDHTFRQYARLTLDGEGKLVKLVVSR